MQSGAIKISVTKPRNANPSTRLKILDAARTVSPDCPNTKRKPNKLVKRKKIPGIQTFERLEQRGLPIQDGIEEVKRNTRQTDVQENRANESPIQSAIRLADLITTHKILLTNPR